MKKRNKDCFNFVSQKVNKKDVYLHGSNMFDTVSKKDLNRMQRQKQKLNRKV